MTRRSRSLSCFVTNARDVPYPICAQSRFRRAEEMSSAKAIVCWAVHASANNLPTMNCRRLVGSHASRESRPAASGGHSSSYLILSSSGRGLPLPPINPLPVCMAFISSITQIDKLSYCKPEEEGVKSMASKGRIVFALLLAAALLVATAEETRELSSAPSS